MSVPPVALGNADPGLAMPFPPNNRPQPLVLVEAEQYPNPAPRKCIGFMLLLSSLLVLRVQQDRYGEVIPYHGAKPDDRKFPWEHETLVSANSSFDATFLALPSLPKMMWASSTFLRSESDASVLITGLGRVVSTGSQHHEAPSGISAVVTGEVSVSLPKPCPGNRTPCYVGLQRDPPVPHLWGNSSCFRYVAGAGMASMKPLPADAKGQQMCLRSGRIRLRAATAGTNGTVAVAWDLPGLRLDPVQPELARTCVAVMGFPGMQVGAIRTVSWASTVFFDQATSSLITIGFSRERRMGDTITVAGRPLITISSFHATTLQPGMRYRLPLSTAWLLRAPHVSDGFLLFIGSESPFVGASFVIDLRKSEVYEQDPPPAPGITGRRRQRLPSKLFVEPPVAGGWPDGTGLASLTGPCQDLLRGRERSP